MRNLNPKPKSKIVILLVLIKCVIRSTKKASQILNCRIPEGVYNFPFLYNRMNRCGLD